MKITIKDSIVVKPASETPRCTLWNSNLDMVMPRVHMPVVYFYKAKEAGDGSGKHIECGRLKEALGKALVPFYPLAGRLKVEKKGRLDIDCNGDGVLFVEATADGCMKEYGEFFAPCKKMRELVPMIDYSTQSPSSFPLLLLQVTVFRCGGMSLGTGVHHQVADGRAEFLFVNYWADIARGVEYDVKPVFDRTLLRARDPPKPEFAHVEYLAPPPLLNAEEEGAGHVKTSGDRAKANEDRGADLEGDSALAKFNEEINDSGGRPLVTGLFIFTKELVESLKNRAAEHTLPGDHPPFTTYEVLSAHVWRCACLARKLQDAQLAKLFIATDGRSRLEPPLPKEYFGNVIFMCTPVERVGRIVKGSLADTARRIRKAVLSMDDRYLRSSIDFLELQPNLANTLQPPCLNVTSLLSMPFYGADFGWGPPLCVTTVILVVEGLAYLLPGPPGDTLVRLSITLPPQHMRRFRELIYQFGKCTADVRALRRKVASSL